MTERVLPAVSLPAPGRAGTGETIRRPRPAAAERPVARPGATTHRKEAFLTTPARAGMLLGASAAVYAVTLAGMSVLQSSSDAAIVARRQPWVDELAARRATNDTIESTLKAADDEARWLAAVYGQAGGDVAAYQARLDSLAALVADVQGTAAALPSRIVLPTVVTRSAVSGRSGGSAPATTTKTRASGG